MIIIQRNQWENRKNFRYKQQKTNSRHYEKHFDRQEIAAAGELAAVQQPKAATKPFSRNNKTQQPRGNARRGRKGTSKLKIIPLGGLEQIGMNITAFEYEDSIVVVDCGLAFPKMICLVSIWSSRMLLI